MKRPRLIIFGLLGLLLLVGGVVAGLRWLRIARPPAQPAGPTVMVYLPENGEQVRANSGLVVSVGAFGRNPVARIELWVNGALNGVQQNASDGYAPAMRAVFPLQLGEGAHAITARAIDVDGLVGQSLPVSISAVAANPTEASYTLVEAAGDQTLEDLALEHGASPEAIEQANPGLAGPAGADSLVRIPLNPDPAGGGEGEGERSANPGIGSAVPSGVGPARVPDQPPLPFISNLSLDLRNLVVTKVEPPAAPSNLLATRSDCKLTLQWDDNADNETNYRVLLAQLGRPGRQIAQLAGSPETGPVWYQFDAPGPGIYVVWVEAVNPAGSQPSPMTGVAWREADCPPGLATDLQLHIAQIRLETGHDRAYCYLSAEGHPEQRVPRSQQAFFKFFAGQADAADLTRQRLTLPIPADGALDLSGECWGWLGGALDKLGSFTTAYSSEQWDGRPLPLNASGMMVELQIRPVGNTEADGLHLYNTYTLAPPYDLDEEDWNDPFAPFNPFERWLTWKWDGAESDITGFTVFLNEVPVQQVSAGSRGAVVDLPGTCGHDISWRVAAHTDAATGLLSGAYSYEQAGCEIWAEVHYLDFGMGESEDSFNFNFIDCEELELYYFQYVNATGQPNIVKQFWGGSFSKPVSCGNVIDFVQLAFPYDRGTNPFRGSVDRIAVPIGTVAAADQGESGGVSFGAAFWDYDWGSDDDLIAEVWQTVIEPLASWPGLEREFLLPFVTDDAYGAIRIAVSGFRGY